jgi:chemotaxis protein methyltransferase CheR
VTITDLASLELSNSQFQTISRIVYDLCGIRLGPGKEGLVKSRLMKRLRQLDMDGFDTYVEFVQSQRGAAELATMIDVLTTNKTSFFRECAHFDYLRDAILPRLRASKRTIRIWSAGCSSGEEPYTIAMVLRQEIPACEHIDARILATDLSSRMLAKAREAVYEQECLGSMPGSMVQKYFICIRTQPPRAYRVNEEVRGLVRLAQLNLMDRWPMKGPFDVIFCRNVMIYFDKPTQQELVRRYWELLEFGGHLFVGHSESLTGSAHRFRYIQPAVYMK